MKFFEELMIEEYLEEAKKKKKYMCISGKQGCYWEGDYPVKQKGDKMTCPVCGGPAGKNTSRQMKESVNEAPVGSKGWTQKSIEKFGKTIGKDAQDKGFFSACVKRMESKKGFDKDKAQGFCASIKDAAYGSPNWRGKGKEKAQAKKDVKKDRFKKQLPKGK